MQSRVKGATLLSTIALLREALPPQKYQELVTACPAETQQLLRRTIVALEWLPADAWSPFLSTLLEQVCRRDENKFRKFMRSVFKRDFSSTYRASLAGVTPDQLIQKLPALWSLLFDGGSLRVESIGSGPTSLIELREFACRSPIFGLVCEAFVAQLFAMVVTGRVEVRRLREQHIDGRLSSEFTLTIERS